MPGSIARAGASQLSSAIWGENRQGLAVATQLPQATGRAERDAAPEMIRKRKVKRGATLGAGKGYNAWTFKRDPGQAGIRPHIALKSETGRGGLPVRTPEGYEISQRMRKRIEETFGWTKTTGGYAKTKFRGKAARRIRLPYRHRGVKPRPITAASCRNCRMSAAINAALCQSLIRRKMVYARQTGLNGSENTPADAKQGTAAVST